MVVLAIADGFGEGAGGVRAGGVPIMGEVDGCHAYLGVDGTEEAKEAGVPLKSSSKRLVTPGGEIEEEAVVAGDAVGADGGGSEGIERRNFTMVEDGVVGIVVEVAASGAGEG